MKICICGPIATEDLTPWLFGNNLQSANLPAGYAGAPLTAIIVGELLKRGHQVSAITVDYGLAADSAPVFMDGPGLQFCVLPGRKHAWRWNGRHLGRALDLFRLERRRLSIAIQNARPDVVHAHWTYEFALGALESQYPVLVTAHDSPRQVWRYTRSLYRALRWIMARSVASKGRHFTAVSDYMAKEWEKMLTVPVSVVPNPVADYVFEESSSIPVSNHAAPEIALVCNGWGARKNVEIGIEGFARFKRQSPGATLHLYGADFGAGEVAEKWASRTGMLDGLFFHGRVPHRQLIAALKHHHVLLHPALEESFGVVVAEALALGLPVVAGACSGAVPWVLGADPHGRSATGVLVDVQSPQEISKGLAEVLNDNYDVRRAAARGCVRHRFSAEAVVDAYIRAYEQVLGAAATGSLRNQSIGHPI